MALPVNIDDLLRCHKVESNRVEFKKGWNPAGIYHTLCAFANDLDGLGDGYVIVGVEEEDGVAKRPVAGVSAEHPMIKNVAAMMFSDHPEQFFPYTQLSVVIFPDGRIQNPNNFTEKTFKGSVPTIIRGAMQYLKDVVVTEYVSKTKDRMKSDRWFNYPYQALAATRADTGRC